MEQEIGLELGWVMRTTGFLLYFIDSELITKMKEQTNLYARQKNS
jgi:hypothetical protein